MSLEKDKPDFRRGDIVQLPNCPKYGSACSHKGRVRSDPQIYHKHWVVSVRYNCLGLQNSMVYCDDIFLIRHSLRSSMSENPWYASKKAINIYIIVGVLLVLILIFGSMWGSVNNTYVNKSQTVSTDKSNISKEEQRRVDLFNNLADAVISAKNFEQDTQTKVAQARGQANSGKIDQAMLTLNSVTEAYPDLKTVPLYQQTMLEMSATENRLAQYRETYNTDVKDYNAYVQGFPSGMFLSFEGKDKSLKPYLDFNVDNTQAQHVFSTEDK